MIGLADGFHAGETFAVTSAIAAENDDAFAGVVTRAPKPIVLVIANRLRQPVFLAEEIDRAGLAVIVRKDRGLRALLGRKRVVNPSNFARHFFPAEFIGEMLRQRTGRLILSLQGLEPERGLVTDIILRR